MMKKFLAVVALMACALGFAGCDESPDTPQEALGIARQAVRDGDLKLLQSTLTGEAARKYGNAEGLAELRERLSDSRKLWLDNLVQTRVEWDKNPYKPYRTARYYTADVMAKRQIGPYATTVSRLWNVSVSCRVYVVGVSHGSPRGTGLSYAEVMRCRISDID